MAKPGISKAQGYNAGIFDHVYDLQGMVNNPNMGRAYIHWLVDMIADGHIKSNQCLQRWLADISLEHDPLDALRDMFEEMTTATAKPKRRVKANSRKQKAA
jgi:hypothetical protein